MPNCFLSRAHYELEIEDLSSSTAPKKGVRISDPIYLGNISPTCGTEGRAFPDQFGRKSEKFFRKVLKKLDSQPIL
jgi:hypothetical protein